MRQVWLLHNALAGSPAVTRRVGEAAEALARRGVAVRVEQAADVAALRAAARAAVAAGADAVLAAGGDGTQGAIAAELAHTPVALGSLPAGTANVWAHALGLPRAWPWRPQALVEAALTLADAQPRATDMGRCNGAWFLVWAGVGMDAAVTQAFERHRDRARRFGNFVYKAGLTFATVARSQPAQARLRAAANGGAPHEAAGQYLMLTMANIGWHGGGLFQLADDARLDDGRMDVWGFAGRGLADALAHAWRVQRRQHQGRADVLRLTAERLEIYTPEPRVYHLDAEPQPAAARLVLEVVPRCLRVLAPRAAARLYQSAA